MKATDFYNLSSIIKSVSITEMKRAVEAHGGEFIWENREEAPVVLANCDIYGPVDVRIIRLFIDERGSLDMEAEVSENNEPIGIDYYDIEESHLQYITDAIDCTDDVKDVSVGIQQDIEEFCKQMKEKIRY